MKKYKDPIFYLLEKAAKNLQYYEGNIKEVFYNEVKCEGKISIDGKDVVEHFHRVYHYAINFKKEADELTKVAEILQNAGF